MGGTQTYEADGNVPVVSGSILEEYRENGSCALARAGYIDLLGNVWSCTMVGDGWVDTVIVRGTEDGAKSEVKVIRMEASEWEGEVSEL